MHLALAGKLESVEDGAHSLLQALEAVSSPATPTEEKAEQVEHTARLTMSTMAASSMDTAVAGAPLRDYVRTHSTVAVGRRCGQNETSRVASGYCDDDFDDPTTCGTLALRRLCLCGLGFALLPPASGAASVTDPAKRRQHKQTTGGAGSPNLAIVPAIAETLVVLAHGEFLHPDTAVLADFLGHGQDIPSQRAASSRGQRQHGQGRPPPRLCAVQTSERSPEARTAASPLPAARPATPSVDVHSDTVSLSSAEGTTSSFAIGAGDGGRRRRKGEPLGVEVAEPAESGGDGGGEGMVVPAPGRGAKGTCMICAGKGPTAGKPSAPAACLMSRGVASLRSMARLLLAQISVSDLQKAQARSFGHVKRRARITAGIEENKPTPAVKRPIGLNSSMKAGGGSGSGSGTAILLRGDDAGDATTNAPNVSPEVAGPQPGAKGGPDSTTRPQRGDRKKPCKQTMPSSPISSCPNACLACRRVVLGHPLDTISYRCGGGSGGCVAVRNRKGGHRLTAEVEAEVGRTAGMGSFEVAPVAGAEKRYLVKHASFCEQLKPAVDAESNEEGSGGARRRKRNGGVGAAAVSEALGDKAVEMVAEQLGSAIKGRRFEHDASVERLAEAHARGKEAKELKLDRKVDFRRRLAAAASEARQEIEIATLRRQVLRGTRDPDRTRRTGGGASSGGENTAQTPAVAGVQAAAASAGKGLLDESKWDENGEFIQPDPAMIASAAAASAAAVTTGTLARWNQQQNQEQRLRQLLDEMKEALDGDDGDDDVCGRRSTLRRGVSSVDSHRSSGSRVSISGSGIYRNLALGVDATHSAILSSMRDDGVDARAYLDERRAAFRDVVAGGEESKNAFLTLTGDAESAKSGIGNSTAGGTTDWEITEENAMDALFGGAGRQSSRNSNHSRSAGGGSSANTSTTGGGGWRDDEAVETTDEEPAAEIRARAVARDAEQLRLARARRAAREERIEIEKREAIEAERGARRRAKDRAEAARAEHKAKALAQKEVQRRRKGLDRQEEEARIERDKGLEERMIAAAAEKKRQAKLRRARERENRKKAALEQARHEEELARIEGWRQQERERKLEIAQQEEEAQRAAEAKRSSKLEAASREEERRRAGVEAKRLALKEEREVAAARLKRGEFRYIRGRLVFREAKGALLMATNNHG
eukprot:g14441.t1